MNGDPIMPAQSAKATSRNIRDALTEYRCPVKPTRWREEPPVVAPPKQTTREPINPYELLKGWLGGLAAAQCIVIILWWVWFCLAWRAEIFWRQIRQSQITAVRPLSSRTVIYTQSEK